MKALALAIFAVLLFGCGTERETVDLGTPDLVIDGVSFVLNSEQAYLTAPDFPARASNVLAAVAGYAGRDVSDFDGLWVVLQDERASCDGEPCLGSFHAGVITVDATMWGDCIENTVLAHELLHSLIKDQCHRDLLWQDWDAYAEFLNAQPETTCHVIGGFQHYYPSC